VNFDLELVKPELDRFMFLLSRGALLAASLCSRQLYEALGCNSGIVRSLSGERILQAMLRVTRDCQPMLKVRNSGVCPQKT
jgi:hypothetical protein